jgi:pantetheine-phosphate adenylyltransferase
MTSQGQITSSDLIRRLYSHGNRFYHNEFHPLRMLKGTLDYQLSETDQKILELAIIFHDAIYNPQRTDNEELSCQEFLNYFPTHEHKDIICELIMATKHHDESKVTRQLAKCIIQLDLQIFSASLTELITYEQGIFKEYQFVNIVEYITKRVEVLKEIQSVMPYPTNIADLIKYVETRVYKIGVYPGSFNPFHIGHANIVKKAEDVFDKVVIARGINPDKKDCSLFDMPKTLLNEIIEYKGLVTDLFERIEDFQNVQLFFVRGLRNVYDIGYEEQLRKTVEGIAPHIKINFVYFFCDSGLEHISSSLIRGLMPFNACRGWLVL